MTAILSAACHWHCDAIQLRQPRVFTDANGGQESGGAGYGARMAPAIGGDTSAQLTIRLASHADLASHRLDVVLEARYGQGHIR